MIRSFLLNKYLSKEFIKIVINASLIFFFLGFVMNIFEEVNFFKDIDIGLYTPVSLSLLYTPSLIYNMFPFIILLSGIWFFLKIRKSDEATAINIAGMSNLSIILNPSLVSILVGIFFITSINPITSVLVKKYESVKGGYERDKDYLAAITANGIWIKEKNLEINNFIRSSALRDNTFIEVSIYIFDQENNFLKRIEAKSANISTTKWDLKNVQIIDRNGKIISKDLKSYSYISMYDIHKINSLYTNLDTISFWEINDEIKLLEERGYSTKEMEAKLQRSFAFPFFLLSMVLLSSVFTLGVNFKENNSTYVFIAIISSVLIYFFNDFSAVLGETEKLPMTIAVWAPVAIVFIFSSIGIINVNQR